MRLYELTNDYRTLMEEIDAGNIPEDAIADTLEAITGSIEEKADSIACILKSIEVEIAAFKAEEDRLCARRKAKQAAHDRLKAYLSGHLLAAGIDKVETPRNKITFLKSESVEIDEEAFTRWAMAFRDDLLIYTAKANKTEVKRAIEEGTEVIGAEIRVNQNIQIK